MEPREICVLKKWNGRNRCIVLSSVVLVTLHELWARMIAWVFPIKRHRLQIRWTYWFHFQWFIFTLETEPPLKAKRVFFILPWKMGGQVAATCRRHTTQRQIAPPCVLENFLWKSLSPRQNFVAATCPRTTEKSNQTEFVRLVAATKSCWRKKIFSQKFSCTHETICRCDVSPQRVASTSRPTCTHGVICRRDVLLQLVA